MKMDLETYPTFLSDRAREDENESGVEDFRPWSLFKGMFSASFGILQYWWDKQETKEKKREKEKEKEKKKQEAVENILYLIQVIFFFPLYLFVLKPPLWLRVLIDPIVTWTVRCIYLPCTAVLQALALVMKVSLWLPFHLLISFKSLKEDGWKRSFQNIKDSLLKHTSAINELWLMTLLAFRTVAFTALISTKAVLVLIASPVLLLVELLRAIGRLSLWALRGLKIIKKEISQEDKNNSDSDGNEVNSSQGIKGFIFRSLSEDFKLCFGTALEKGKPSDFKILIDDFISCLFPTVRSGNIVNWFVFYPLGTLSKLRPLWNRASKVHLKDHMAREIFKGGINIFYSFPTQILFGDENQPGTREEKGINVFTASIEKAEKPNKHKQNKPKKIHKLDKNKSEKNEVNEIIVNEENADNKDKNKIIIDDKDEKNKENEKDENGNKNKEKEEEGGDEIDRIISEDNKNSKKEITTIDDFIKLKTENENAIIELHDVLLNWYTPINSKLLVNHVNEKNTKSKAIIFNFNEHSDNCLLVTVKENISKNIYIESSIKVTRVYLENNIRRKKNELFNYWRTKINKNNESDIDEINNSKIISKKNNINKKINKKNEQIVDKKDVFKSVEEALQFIENECNGNDKEMRNVGDENKNKTENVDIITKKKISKIKFILGKIEIILNKNDDNESERYSEKNKNKMIKLKKYVTRIVDHLNRNKDRDKKYLKNMMQRLNAIKSIKVDHDVLKENKESDKCDEKLYLKNKKIEIINTANKYLEKINEILDQYEFFTKNEKLDFNECEKLISAKKILNNKIESYCKIRLFQNIKNGKYNNLIKTKDVLDEIMSLIMKEAKCKKNSLKIYGKNKSEFMKNMFEIRKVLSVNYSSKSNKLKNKLKKDTKNKKIKNIKETQDKNELRKLQIKKFFNVTETEEKDALHHSLILKKGDAELVCYFFGTEKQNNEEIEIIKGTPYSMRFVLTLSFFNINMMKKFTYNSSGKFNSIDLDTKALKVAEMIFWDDLDLDVENDKVISINKKTNKKYDDSLFLSETFPLFTYIEEWKNKFKKEKIKIIKIKDEEKGEKYGEYLNLNCNLLKKLEYSNNDNNLIENKNNDNGNDGEINNKVTKGICVKNIMIGLNFNNNILNNSNDIQNKNENNDKVDKLNTVIGFNEREKFENFEDIHINFNI